MRHFESNDGDRLIAVLRGLETYYESKWLYHLRRTIQKFPQASIEAALSRQQIISKKWAIEKIHAAFGANLGTVFILGGWYGTLAAMMYESQRFSNLVIRSFDIDPECAVVADAMNQSHLMNNWQFKAVTADMYDLNYTNTNYSVQRPDGSLVQLSSVPDLVINFSCEHLHAFSKWYSAIPDGMPLALQSNDFFTAQDHVNCVASLGEFQEQTPMREVSYEGTIELPNYKRFMRIGRK